MERDPVPSLDARISALLRAAEPEIDRAAKLARAVYGYHAAVLWSPQLGYLGYDAEPA